MMHAEKERLLLLLSDAGRWCQHVEGRDAQGNPVHMDDDAAIAWDLSGAVYRLFGLERAGPLWVQIDRHINGKRREMSWPPRDVELDAMISLQVFNDRSDTTYPKVRLLLESLPVWTGRAARNGGMSVQGGA